MESTGGPLSVELGPGVMGSIFDGIQRPLEVIKGISGDYIARGIDVDSIDKEKKWTFEPVAKRTWSSTRNICCFTKNYGSTND